MSDVIAEETLSKGGEVIIRAHLQRSLKDGATISVWAHPAIEAFFKDAVVGHDVLNVSAYGSIWRRLKGQPPLLAYPIIGGLGGDGSQRGYTILPIGEGIHISERASGVRGGIVNVSFLRLVGISEGTGVKFGIGGLVSSEEGLDRLTKQIFEGTKEFYREYLKPFNVTLELVSNKL